MEVSLTENGVGGTRWDVRPGRESGSRKVFRRSSERARDELHNKFMKGTFEGSGGDEEQAWFRNRVDPLFLAVPAFRISFAAARRRDRNWARPAGSAVRQTRVKARVKSARSLFNVHLLFDDHV